MAAMVFTNFIQTEEYMWKISYTLFVLSYKSFGVSEWVIVFKRQISNFSPISWREQINFQWDDDEVRFVLDQNA